MAWLRRSFENDEVKRSEYNPDSPIGNLPDATWEPSYSERCAVTTFYGKTPNLTERRLDRAEVSFWKGQVVRVAIKYKSIGGTDSRKRIGGNAALDKFLRSATKRYGRKVSDEETWRNGGFSRYNLVYRGPEGITALTVESFYDTFYLAGVSMIDGRLGRQIEKCDRVERERSRKRETEAVDSVLP